MKESHCLNFSWSTSPWLSLNLTYVFISSRLSMGIFLGRKAARMAPLKLVSILVCGRTISKEYDVVDVVVTPSSASHRRPN